jgi:hypothetical protein
VLFELCERLNMTGIEPLGALEHTSTMVEKHIWHAAVEKSTVDDSEMGTLQARLL